MTRQRNAAQAEAARQQAAAQATQPNLPPSTQAVAGPIDWGGLNWGQSGDSSGTIFRWLGVSGRVGPSPIQIKRAYLQSDLTGERRDMLIDGGYAGRFAPGDANPIPAGAPITLVAPFDPPLRIRDFVSQWGKIDFVVEYENAEQFVKIFGEEQIHQMLSNFPDSGIGPRPTKKQ